MMRARFIAMTIDMTMMMMMMMFFLSTQATAWWFGHETSKTDVVMIHTDNRAVEQFVDVIGASLHALWQEAADRVLKRHR